MKKLMVALLALAFLAPAFALAGARDVLSLKYGIMECRTNALVSLIEYGEDNTNLSSGGLAGQIQDHMNALEAYADGGDRMGFNEYVRTTMREDVRDAVLFLNDVRKEFIKGGNGGQGNQGGSGNDLQDYFKTVVDQRHECIQDAALGFAQGEKVDMEARLGNMGSAIERLKNKSVNTSEMEDIYQEAQDNFEEFENAVEGGNATEVYETVRAIREQHLHIWARFHIARFQAILDSIDDAAKDQGYSSEVSEIEALLSDAASTVAAGEPYDPGEFEEVKGSLGEVAIKLRDLIAKLR